MCAKIILNRTIDLFLKTAISVLLISNHNGFRVLFDKIASVYFIFKDIVICQHWKRPAQGTGTVPVVSAQCRSRVILVAAQAGAAICSPELPSANGTRWTTIAAAAAAAGGGGAGGSRHLPARDVIAGHVTRVGGRGRR